MGKLETILCATTWGLMNALLIAVAFGSVLPDPIHTAPPAQLASAATLPSA